MRHILALIILAFLMYAQGAIGGVFYFGNNEAVNLTSQIAMSNGPKITSGIVNLTGVGYAAPAGSIYLRSDTGELWVKRTALATDWVRMTNRVIDPWAAAASYEIGDLLLYNHQLYRATADFVADANFWVDFDAGRFTLESQTDLIQSITNVDIPAELTLQRAAGTFETPTDIGAGDSIGSLTFSAKEFGAAGFIDLANISVFAEAPWDATDQATVMSFVKTNNDGDKTPDLVGEFLADGEFNTYFGISNTGEIVSSGDIVNNGVLRMAEVVTPLADPNYGAIYPKADDRLYFQDGAGVEKTVLTSEDITFDISSPQLDQLLRYNGADWVNVPGFTPTGVSLVQYFLDNTASDIGGYLTLLAIPSGAVMNTETVTVNNNTVAMEEYATVVAGLGGTTIEGGEWVFNTYAYVDDAAGTTVIDIEIYSRTAAGVETLLFTVSTQDINQLTSPMLYEVRSVQPSYALSAGTDRLVAKYYGRTDNVGDIDVSYTLNGTSTYSNFKTPLVTRHNTLSGIQGGAADEAYHLNATEHSYVSGVNAQSVLTTATPEFNSGTVEIGTDDSLGRDQIWNYGTNSIFRSGSATVAGDATDVAGHGFIVYGPNIAGDPFSLTDYGYGEMTNARFQLFNEDLSTGVANYIFLADASGISLKDNAGTTNFSVDRLTGNIFGNGAFQLGATTAITAILDEDDMASDSDTAVPTQQSVKAYVDSTIVGGSVAGTITNTYEGMNILLNPGAEQPNAAPFVGWSASNANIIRNNIDTPHGTYSWRFNPTGAADIQTTNNVGGGAIYDIGICEISFWYKTTDTSWTVYGRDGAVDIFSQALPNTGGVWEKYPDISLGHQYQFACTTSAQIKLTGSGNLIDIDNAYLGGPRNLNAADLQTSKTLAGNKDDFPASELAVKEFVNNTSRSMDTIDSVYADTITVMDTIAPFTEPFDVMGRDSTFGGGANAFQGTLTLETGSFVSSKYFKYVAGANAYDYFAKTKTLTAGQTGREIAFIGRYSNNGSVIDNDFQAVIQVGSNAPEVVSLTSSNTTVEKFAVSVFVPYNAAGETITFGIYHVVSGVGAEFYTDGWVLTSDPFLYKNLTDEQQLSIAEANPTSSGAAGDYLIKFPGTQTSLGANIISVDNSGSYSIFRALSDCSVVVSSSMYTPTASYYLWVEKNEDNVKLFRGTSGGATGHIMGVSGSLTLKQGEYFVVHAFGYDATKTANIVITALAGSEHVVTPAKNSASDATAYTPTFTGFGTPTNVNFYWRRSGADLEVYGYFTVGTTTATEARISFPSGLTSASGIPTIYSAGLAVSSRSDNNYVVLAEPSVTYFTMARAYSTAGTIDKATGSNLFSSGHNVSFFAKVPISGWSAESQFLGMIPRKSSLQITTANGYASTATYARKFSGTPQIYGGDISYTSDAVNGDYFTINTAGNYSFTYRDKAAATPSVSTFLTVNNNAIANVATTSIAKIYESVANYPMVASGTKYLNAGDKIYCLVDTPARVNGTTEAYVHIQRIDY